MNNRYIIMDTSCSPSAIWGHTDHEYQVHEALLSSHLPTSWNVVDRELETIIADSEDGFYDNEHGELFT